jgi:hypothetical protein
MKAFPSLSVVFYPINFLCLPTGVTVELCFEMQHTTCQQSTILVVVAVRLLMADKDFVIADACVIEQKC